MPPANALASVLSSRRHEFDPSRRSAWLGCRAMLGNTPQHRTRVAVVGGGILGVAVARELVLKHPGIEVVVFEKEAALGRHQTGHNSGVVHAGIYYRPGSLKADLCARGRALLKDYCVEHHLPFVECGKVVVAAHPAETQRLDALEASAHANQVPGLRRIDARQLRELEPHAAGVAALHSPGTAITDFVAITEALAVEVTHHGGEVRLHTRVTDLARSATQVRVNSTGPSGRNQELFDAAILCPGLHADRLAGRADGENGPRIVPFRGEYLALKESRTHLVRSLIYPVPDPRYPFLGVHLTRRVDGGVDIGPNAVIATRREGYRRADFSARDIWDLASWPGFWRLAGAHWRTGVREVHGSLSKGAFLQAAQRYLPGLQPSDIEGVHAGVRAQAVDQDGSLVDDFRITQVDTITAIRNAPSPAATSSLAIAEYVVARLPRFG